MPERFSCPTCGHENEAGQRFCGSCGGRLVLTCEVCGGANRLDSRFCGNCGADLLASTASELSGEERRVITVLFADLVGFTSYRAVTGPIGHRGSGPPLSPAAE